MWKSMNIQPAPSPQTPSSLRAGEENPYVLFVYNPQKNFYHTQCQASGFMNTDMININKQVNNKKWLYQN